jgi:hypothetical protein
MGFTLSKTTNQFTFTFTYGYDAKFIARATGGNCTLQSENWDSNAWPETCRREESEKRKLVY